MTTEGMLSRFRGLSKVAQALVAIGLLVVSCFLCGVVGNLLPDAEPTPTPEPTATYTPAPTDTAAPTAVPSDTPVPTATPDAEAAQQAIADWAIAFNNELGQVFFRQAGIVEDGERCSFVVDDTWYLLETFVKERLLEQAAEQCAIATVIHGYRKAGPETYPTTSFYSVSKKEVAFKSTFRTKINE